MERMNNNDNSSPLEMFAETQIASASAGLLARAKRLREMADQLEADVARESTTFSPSSLAVTAIDIERYQSTLIAFRGVKNFALLAHAMGE